MGRRGRKRSAQAGFSVLEALIAVAILGSGLSALFVVQQQLVSTSLRTEQRLSTHSAELAAERFIRGLNLSVYPEGSFDLGGGWVVSWVSSGVLGPSEGYGFGFRLGVPAGVWHVRVEVSGPGGEVSVWGQYGFEESVLE